MDGITVKIHCFFFLATCPNPILFADEDCDFFGVLTSLSIRAFRSLISLIRRFSSSTSSIIFTMRVVLSIRVSRVKFSKLKSDDFVIFSKDFPF